MMSYHKNDAEINVKSNWKHEINKEDEEIKVKEKSLQKNKDNLNFGNAGELYLIRCGESELNASGKFAGWLNPKLSLNGIEESMKCGRFLKEMNIKFDVCYTSILKRAITTWNYIADEMDLHYIPIKKYWQLNARHYGALQGMLKSDISENYGVDQLNIWRMSGKIVLPDIDDDDPNNPKFDPLFKEIPVSCIPLQETLNDTIKRLENVYYENIYKDILEGKNVVVVSHQNTMRALVTLIEGLSEIELYELEFRNCETTKYKMNVNNKLIHVPLTPGKLSTINQSKLLEKNKDQLQKSDQKIIENDSNDLNKNQIE